MDEINIFTPDYFLDLFILVIAILVNFYVYFSLKKTFKFKNDIYILHFSKAFLFFGVSTLFSLLSFITIILIVSIGVDSQYLDMYVDVPYNLAFIVGLVYLYRGAKNIKVLRVI
ncbi:hypothetical protein HH219_18455 [Pseudoalteromonas sp. NEC-BIFX-2020_015]|uniref:hypothetical protein n=1 Tax=Pseudoalteromonas sp. NEC-BIFX-2020_015 TaxID=2729544 RepID=UPI0014615C60|nr:hypothetical protein [Pseudoalteromonas sp. NEC-BIFX-2020_015]NMR27494.1 hypothetical protein [Pseudoalteromonas sp. NEC-BIFX-2020_015]